MRLLAPSALTSNFKNRDLQISDTCGTMDET